MAKRVVLGRYGSGSNDYGLRVSKDGEDVVSLDGSGNLQAAVSAADLIFDSSTATGGFSLYKAYEITVAAGADAGTAAFPSGGFGQQVTPGSTTQSFGETLSFIPLTLCQKIVSSTEQETVFLRVTEIYTAPLIPLAYRGAPYFPTMNSAYYLDPQGPDDAGWGWETTTSNITITNYSTTSSINVRVALFNAPAT